MRFSCQATYYLHEKLFTRMFLAPKAVEVGRCVDTIRVRRLAGWQSWCTMVAPAWQCSPPQLLHCRQQPFYSEDELVMADIIRTTLQVAVAHGPP